NDDVLEIMRWRPRRGRRDVLAVPQVLGARFASLRLESDGRGNVRWTYRREAWPSKRALHVTVARGEDAPEAHLQPATHVRRRREQSPFPRRASSVGALAIVAAGFAVAGHIGSLVTAAYTHPDLGETFEDDWHSYYGDHDKEHLPGEELTLIRIVR